jgi:trimethylamine---corrinoid protein Co-methyltransferase
MGGAGTYWGVDKSTPRMLIPMEPLRILTAAQMEQIDTAAQTILERTGVRIDSPEALDSLKRFGGQVDEAARLVKLPRQLSRQVIAKMRQDYRRADRPERMPVRFSHVRFRPAEHRIHDDFTVSAGGFCCFIHDLAGNRRLANRDDVLCAINMVNHLDQIDYTGLPISDQTTPADHRPVVMAAELVKWTRKIGGIETVTKEDVRWIHEIAQVVAGSTEELQRRPALIGYGELRTPLCFDRNMAEVFMEYVKLGVPQTVDTMPAGGATAPVTGPAILALGAAETLFAVALAYAIREDAVVAMDITPSYADMRTGLYKYSGCDRWNLLMARVQLLSEYYGCPTGVHGGKTDSCFYNEQAGAEKMASMLLPILAGAVGIGTVGHLENAITFSPLQLVLDNEMARCVRRAIRPWTVDGETLATELIAAVGPGGSFLSESHTADHFRDEMFLSTLFPVRPWADAHGHSDQYDQTQKARQIATELWRKPDEPVLSEEQIRSIDVIVKRATE